MADSPSNSEDNINPTRVDPYHVSAWRERLKIYGAALIAGLVVGLYALIIAKHSGGDLSTLYLADARYRHGQPIYWMAPELEAARASCPEGDKVLVYLQIKSLTTDELVKLPPCMHPNLNPPFFILLTVPLAYLGFEAAWGVWFCLSFVGVLALVWIMQRQHLIPPGPASFGLVSLGFLLYVPTLANFFLGQVTFLVMLPLVLGWVALRQQRDRVGGAWLGLAASLKPFLGLIWLGLVLLDNRRAAITMALAGLVCGVIGLQPGGWDAYTDYFQALKTIDWQASSWNASLDGFFSRLLGGSQNIPWIDAPTWARGLSHLASLAVLAIYTLTVRRTLSLDAASRTDWLMALSMPAMLLISPLGWLYYFPFLLLTALVVWRAGGAMKKPRRFRGALIATLALSSLPSWLISAKQMSNPLDWFGATAFYTVALVQLFVMAVMAARRETRPLSVN